MNQSDPAQTINAQREIVFISGMHRSGTSAFTRVCNLLGGVLPQPLVEPAIGNELGHWEPAEVVAMNDRALLAAGNDVNDVAPVSPIWLRSKAANQFVDEIEAYLDRLGDAPQTWFIKDPRISLLAGLWCEGAERTGVEPRFVIAFRNPWEVAVSLSSRQLKYFPDEIWPIERGLALWLKYMLSIERRTRGFRRSFIDYETFLGDWSADVQRVYDQLGLPQPVLDDKVRTLVEQFLKPEERHARHEAMRTRSTLATHVYELFLERLSDPQGGKAALEKAAGTFAGSFGILGGYMKALETRVSEVATLKTRAVDAEGRADDLGRTLEAANLQIIHVARATAAKEREHDAGDGEAFTALKLKHAALTAAHRQNVDEYKIQHKAWRSERDQLFEKQASALLEAVEREREVSRAERRRLLGDQAFDLLAAIELERDVSRVERRRLLKGQAFDLLSAIQLERTSSLGDRDQLIERQAADLLAALELEHGVARADGEQTIEPVPIEMPEPADRPHLELSAQRRRDDASKAPAHRDEDSFTTAVNALLSELRLKDKAIATLGVALQKQAQTVADGREAYEDLRLEAAAARARLQSEIDARRQLVRDDADRAVMADALADTRSELALIHRSRSWKLTSPLRAASGLFGRR